MLDKKTKIIATIGPSSEDKKTIGEFIKEGMNIARLNFSHGDYETHLKKIKILKEYIKKGSNVAIMLDTKGPEIRCGNFEGGKASFIKGQNVSISMKPLLGTNKLFSVSYPKLINDVAVGHLLRFDDGKLNFKITKIDKKNNLIICNVINNHTLSDKKSCSAPNTKLKMNFLSKKDKDDIAFACKNDLDYIAASFTRCKEDILSIRKLLEENKNKHIQIIAKIECQEGVDNIDEIIQASDGIMVARGDLGVELNAEDVPVIQRLIIRKCKAYGKPVIVATHMLDSMVNSPTPTRAEVSDVATAIYEAVDAIMLSGESASGKYPVESVKMEARIARRIEKLLNSHVEAERAYMASSRVHNDAIAYGVASAAIMTDAKLIVAFSESGSTSRRISKYRPQCPIVSVSKKEAVARSLCLDWGVYGIHQASVVNSDENAIKIAKNLGYKKNDTILLTGGNGKGSTNFMKIIVID